MTTPTTLSELREAVLARMPKPRDLNNWTAGFGSGLDAAASLITAYEQQAQERAAVLAQGARRLMERAVFFSGKGSPEMAAEYEAEALDAINKLAALAGGQHHE